MRTSRLIMACCAAAALAACRAAPKASAAAAAPVQSEAEREVLAVVQRLFDAMQARDTAGVRALFETGARLVGMRTNAAGETRLQVLTVDRFVTFIGQDQRGEWLERAFDARVQIDRTLATVWAQYDFHLGGTFSHCGTDAVQLLQTADGWKIVTLADTYITEACPQRPPPG